MEKQISTGSVLACGIIALVFCYMPILGIILACVARGRAKKFIRLNGSVYGPAKVGNILSKIALPISIVMLVFWVIYFIAIGALVASNF